MGIPSQPSRLLVHTSDPVPLSLGPWDSDVIQIVCGHNWPILLSEHFAVKRSLISVLTDRLWSVPLMSHLDLSPGIPVLVYFDRLIGNAVCYS